MYLGLDLGTSGVKALLVDRDQRVIASTTSPLAVSRPHSGWSEQDPGDWILATEAAMAALKSMAPDELSCVRGIGLSGQMHGATLLGEADEVLRPCILWNDTRSHAQAARLDANPQFRAIAGNIVFPGFTAPKIAWVEEEEPEIFARLRHVLLPKDFLRLWLTGDYVSEMSDASGSAWLDVGNRCWSAELLDATHLDVRHVPALVEGSAVSGYLKPELGRNWGMAPEVVVAGGGGDNAATACGMGVVTPGRAFISIGTSGVLFAANDRYSPNPASAVHAFCHALPGAWHQMGVILSATDALNWFSSLVGHPPADLTHALGDTLQPPSDVTFLPFLAGERTPHNDVRIRGSFTGFGHNVGQKAMTQAVLEGVAFAFRDCRDALAAAGTQLERVVAVGGGAQSRYWLRSIATALDVPVDVPAEGDYGAALGAARLGLIAAEGADPVEVCKPPAAAETIEPETALRDAYDAAHDRYRRLYPAILGATT
ncbi:xylulokinase [Rhodoligotrophos appendicifer]|uniref:xylulokinase n=1 Tax=Rhodoligotrophos appendicifer TaxID=987056 RepID=UPI001187029E|nr:xylulokinase [Rhodoligotrophos appendicifer]